MRRLRFRYSIWAMLAAVAAVAVFLGASRYAARYTERERARRSLATVRHAAALKSYQSQLDRFKEGEVALEAVYTWSLKLMEARRDLAGTPGDRVAAAEAHRKRMGVLQTYAQAAIQRGGCVDRSQFDAINYYVLEADYWVATER
jgi:hypothetical protein